MSTGVEAPAAAGNDGIVMTPLPELDAGRLARTEVLNLYSKDSEPVARLGQLGIDVGRLIRAYPPPRGLRILMKAALDQGSKSDIRRAPAVAKLAALEFQDETLRAGCLQQTCPVSGVTARSIHAISAGGWIFYRFQTEVPFLLAAGGYSSGFARILLWLPAMDLVIGLNPSFHRARALSLLEGFQKVTREVKPQYQRYVENPVGAGVALLLNAPPFPHHLWNELPGLHRLLNAGLLDRVERVYVCEEPLGPVGEIFPEIGAKIVRCSTKQALRQILSRHETAVRPGSILIPAELIERVARVARHRKSPFAVAALEQIDRTRLPVLGISIRTVNRRWRSQREGIVQLLRELHRRGLRFQVVLFGFSIPHQAGAESVPEPVIRDETGVCEYIVERCPEIPIVTLLGRPIFDCTVLAERLCFYIAHHGTIQHKIGWFANCSGIVHANRQTIEGQRAFFATLFAREGGVRPSYIPLDAVRDVEEASGARGAGRGNLQDYDFDWRVLMEGTAAALTGPAGRDRCV